jgi:hemolysin activation/secretion protein
MAWWRPFAERACGLLVALGGALAFAPSFAHADAPPPTAGPQGEPVQHVDIEAYDIDGASLLDQAVVEGAVYPFLGPDRTRADVDSAREALEKAYHDRGFQSVVVEIPPQTVTDNIVRLHVIEAPVGRLRVVGSRYFSPEEIKHEAPSLKEGSTPDFRQTQKELADLNRIPDRQISPVLRPGKIPGTVDVDLKVKDELPLHASAEVNNDHAQFTPDLRTVGTVRYDNLWQLGHTVSFIYSVAPEDRSSGEIFSGSYMAPIWGSPWSVLAYGYKSDSNVNSLGGVNVLGKGYAIGVRGIRQLPPLAGFSPSISFGADFKNFDQDITTVTSKVTTTSTVPIKYWPVTGVFSLQRAKGDSLTKLSLGATLGIRDLGAGDSTFDNNRVFARPNFVHFNLDFDQTQGFHGFEAELRLTGQLADQPLVTNEEIAAGGNTSVRGYLQAEAVGDDGFTGSFELRSPAIAPGLAPFVSDWRSYAFVDGGWLKVLDPLPGQQDEFGLASVGLGTRILVFRHLRGDVAVAWPLERSVATKPHQPRAVFSVKSEF